jgi:predicted O-methyltransferase YrrM
MLTGALRTVREAPAAVGFLSALARHGSFQLDRIPTHLRRAERYRLYDLARTVRGPILEVGSYLGASAGTLALGLREQGGDVAERRLYCVDTWQNDTMSEGSRDTFAEFRRNVRDFEDMITVLRGRSVDVARNFRSPLGMLFVDGDHSYEGVTADIEAWLPKLRKGGVAVFHDIGWAEGVQRAVREHVLPRARRHRRLTNLLWAWL